MVKARLPMMRKTGEGFARRHGNLGFVLRSLVGLTLAGLAAWCTLQGTTTGAGISSRPDWSLYAEAIRQRGAFFLQLAVALWLLAGIAWAPCIPVDDTWPKYLKSTLRYGGAILLALVLCTAFGFAIVGLIVLFKR